MATVHVRENIGYLPAELPSETMKGHECYHCKQWVAEGEAHDCWTTTEAALTRDLSEDLREAWERLRETAAEFGEQRIYASHNSIMFSRKSCYVFVRPKKSVLEVVVFLSRAVRAPQVRRADAASKTKVANFLRITHRDEIEAPITDWLHEAYEMSGNPPVRAVAKAKKASTKTKPKKSVEKRAVKRTAKSGSRR